MLAILLLAERHQAVLLLAQEAMSAPVRTVVGRTARCPVDGRTAMRRARRGDRPCRGRHGACTANPVARANEATRANETIMRNEHDTARTSGLTGSRIDGIPA